MMRVPFKASLARSAAWLAAGAVFFAACSSKPIDDPSATDTPDGASPTGGSGSVIPSTAAGTTSSAGTSPDEATAGTATAAPSNAPIYQKQDYPAGPYGTGVRATLENFAFLGWHDPVAANYDQNKLEQVHLAEYYNPDGRSDVKLIWINASAVWCSVCRAEMTDIKDNGVHASFGPRGVQMIVTLFEDNKSGPAKPMDLHNWGSLPAHAIDFPLLLDPGFKLGAFFTSDATPLNMLVDAKTMKVLDATMGYSADYWQRVDKLLAKLK
jgi:hypothetical protein